MENNLQEIGLPSVDDFHSYVIVDGVVHDVSGFLDQHPGGRRILQSVLGTDISQTFHRVGHSLYAVNLLQKLAVGRISSPLTIFADGTATIETKGHEGEEEFYSDLAEPGSSYQKVATHDESTALQSNQMIKETSARFDQVGGGVEEEAEPEVTVVRAREDRKAHHLPHTVITCNQQHQVDYLENSTIATRWHRIRQRKIIQDHPQVIDLFGYNNWTIVLGVLVILLHAVMSILCQYVQSWWVVLLIAATIGATCRMYQFMVGHELVHRLVSPFWNTYYIHNLLLILMNLPSFGNFLHFYVSLLHLGHHASLGRHSDSSRHDGLQIEEFYHNTHPGNLKADGDLISPNFIRQFLLSLFPQQRAGAVGRFFFLNISILASQLIFLSQELVMVICYTWIFFPLLVCLVFYGVTSVPTVVCLLITVPLTIWWTRYYHYEAFQWSTWSLLFTWSWIALCYFLAFSPSFLNLPANQATSNQDVSPGKTVLYLFSAELFFHGFFLHPFGGYFMAVHDNPVNVPELINGDVKTHFKHKKRQELESMREMVLTASSTPPPHHPHPPSTSSSYFPLLDRNTDEETEPIASPEPSEGFGFALSSQVEQDDQVSNEASYAPTMQETERKEDVQQSVSIPPQYQGVINGHQDYQIYGKGRMCQPTTSIYGRWTGLLTGNLNLHVEHHDFPTIPWFHLSQLAQIAPEYYQGLKQTPHLFFPIWQHVWNGVEYQYSCE